MLDALNIEEKIELIKADPSKATKEILDELVLYYSGCDSVSEMENAYTEAQKYMASEVGIEELDKAKNSKMYTEEEFWALIKSDLKR